MVSDHCLGSHGWYKAWAIFKFIHEGGGSSICGDMDSLQSSHVRGAKIPNLALRSLFMCTVFQGSPETWSGVLTGPFGIKAVKNTNMCTNWTHILSRNCKAWILYFIPCFFLAQEVLSLKMQGGIKERGIKGKRTCLLTCSFSSLSPLSPSEIMSLVQDVPVFSCSQNKRTCRREEDGRRQKDYFKWL